MVGDDDQAIYQWRGSDARNIVEFASRYPGVRTFKITVNRRSRPHIVEAAASFARSIPDRLDKEMSALRDPNPVEVVTWAADTEAEECDRIAETIQRLHAAGLPYRRAAVLVRTRAAYPRLLEAFDAHGVPVQPAGRTGLFARPGRQSIHPRTTMKPNSPVPPSPNSMKPGDTKSMASWSHMSISTIRHLPFRCTTRSSSGPSSSSATSVALLSAPDRGGGNPRRQCGVRPRCQASTWIWPGGSARELLGVATRYPGHLPFSRCPHIADTAPARPRIADVGLALRSLSCGSALSV